MKNKYGFTITEMLIVVIIISIISTISLIGVKYIKSNMESIKVNEIAKEIYIASQNRLLEYKSMNETIDWEYKGENIIVVPSDYELWKESIDELNIECDFSSTGNMFVVSNNDTNSKTLINDVFLPFGSIDNIDESGQYFIEYNASTLTVYGVFYLESNSNISYDDLISDLNWSGRPSSNVSKDEAKKARDEYVILDENTPVGYYGGGLLDNIEKQDINFPEVAVKNGEDLILSIIDKNDIDTNIFVTISGDESGFSKEFLINKKNNTFQIDEKIFSLDLMAYDNNSQIIDRPITKTEKIDGYYSYNILLDSILEYYGNESDEFENRHFSYMFGEDYVLGENIEITVNVRPTNGYIGLTRSRTVHTNCLFNDMNDGVAEISYIRHLENLSTEISNVNDYITKVSLANSISFSGYGIGVNSTYVKNYNKTSRIMSYNGFSCSNMNSFIPINNANIKNIDGNGENIYDLVICGINEHVGLFGKVNDLNVCDLGLVMSNNDNINYRNPYIKTNIIQNENVGSFVGEAENITFQNCYSTFEILIESEKDDSSKNIAIGGFVGKCDGTLSIDNCYMSGRVDDSGNYLDNIYSVVPKNSNSIISVGSFVGMVENDEAVAKIQNSYSTSSIYVDGDSQNAARINAGGFIGKVKSNKTLVNIDHNSYYAAPLKTNICCEWSDKGNSDKKLNVRIGGIIGDINLSENHTIDIKARFVEPYLNYCGVPLILAYGNYKFKDLVLFKDEGLEFLNNFGNPVDISELKTNEISKDSTISISKFLKNNSYPYSDITMLKHHFGDWNDRLIEITVNLFAGNGIKSINDFTWNGDENHKWQNIFSNSIILLPDVVTLKEGYEGFDYRIDYTGANGVLIHDGEYCYYYPGPESANIYYEAKSIITPKTNLIGGGSFLYNYEDVDLELNILNSYDDSSNFTFYYSLVDDVGTINNTITKAEDISKTNFIISKDAYHGIKSYKVDVYVSDGILTSKTSASNLREVELTRAKIKFNVNNSGRLPKDGKLLCNNFGYIEYNNKNIYTDVYNDQTMKIDAARSNHELLGWSFFIDKNEPINLSAPWKPESLDDIEIYAIWKFIRQRIDLYSGIGWFE